MTDENVTLSLAVQPNVKPALRKEAARQGFSYGGEGSISKFMNHLADRLDAGAGPFRGGELKDVLFDDLFAIAESAKQDCSHCEGEVVRILRVAARRRYSDLQSQMICWG